MQHTLNLTADELNMYPGKGYIIMKHDPLLEPGDTMLLTHGREQIPMTVTHIETTPHVYKGWAVVGLTPVEEKWKSVEPLPLLDEDHFTSTLR